LKSVEFVFAGGSIPRFPGDADPLLSHTATPRARLFADRPPFSADARPSRLASPQVAERGLHVLAADVVGLLGRRRRDPSLANGHRVFYEREVPFELRTATGTEEPQEVGALEAIKVRILAVGPEGAYSGLRIELTSENNLFFHYAHELDAAEFGKLQEAQRLMVEFTEYPAVIVRNLNHCVKEPHSHLAVFVMTKDGGGRLDFVQNMEYKFVELLSLNFQASPEETVREQIAYRYNAVKGKLATMQARLADINALVKVKNPSLLLQMKKTGI
jgi:hypothetical protein